MERVFISAWAISGADIMLLEKWHNEGMIGSVEILVGDIFPSKYEMEWKKILELEERGIINAVYKSTIHSKLLLMEAHDGTKLVIESSANCNMNPRVEQSCVTISEKLFDFYWVYIHDMFEEDQARAVVRAEVEEMKEEASGNEARNVDIDEWLAVFREDELGA